MPGLTQRQQERGRESKSERASERESESGRASEREKVKCNTNESLSFYSRWYEFESAPQQRARGEAARRGNASRERDTRNGCKHASLPRGWHTGGRKIGFYFDFLIGTFRLVWLLVFEASVMHH